MRWCHCKGMNQDCPSCGGKGYLVPTGAEAPPAAPSKATKRHEASLGNPPTGRVAETNGKPRIFPNPILETCWRSRRSTAPSP